MLSENLKAGQRVHVSGYSDELGISDDYHCSVNSYGTLEENMSPNKEKMLVTLDRIDGDTKACVRIWRKCLNSVRQGENLSEEDIIFDSCISGGKTDEELVGYLWCTDKLVSLVGDAHRRNVGAQLNIYPVYNLITDQLTIIRNCSYDVTPSTEEEIILPEKDNLLIKQLFKEYYM